MLNLKPSVALVYSLAAGLAPFDALEKEHIDDALAWIASGVPVFRTAKPDIPPKHLVSYFLLFDEAAQKILLVDHKKAQSWLPSGGHVEPDEDPKETVRRECEEELFVPAEFWREEPLFLTSRVTIGLTAGHTDVTFWYVLKGDSQKKYAFDAEEFNAIQWFGFDEIPYDKADPHLGRFLEKLKAML